MFPRRNTKDSAKNKIEETIFISGPEALKYAWKSDTDKFTY